jgi:hypothetical protein
VLVWTLQEKIFVQKDFTDPHFKRCPIFLGRKNTDYCLSIT